MTGKKMSWECSNQRIFFSLILLLFSFQNKSMDQIYQLHDIKKSSTSSRSIHRKFTNQSSYFYGKSTEELEMVFKYAPWKAKEIVDHLKDPQALAEPAYRGAFFVGRPGTGKTTTAIAIPMKAKWGCKFIRCSELQKSYRNRASEELLNQLNEVKSYIAEGEKTVVIADELGLLLKKPSDSHRDNDATSGALQGFLDDMEGEDNFFFIGTLNDDTDMTETMKERIELDRIVFEPIIDAAIKRDVFRNTIKTSRMSLHSECTDEILDDVITKLSNCPFRSYKNMRKELSRILHHEEPHKKIRFIKRQHLEQVTATLLQARKDLKIGKPEKTGEQRQECYFKKNAKLQFLLHKDSLRQQDQHFVQQQAINLVTSNGKEKNSSVNLFGMGYTQDCGLKQSAQDIITDRILNSNQQLYWASCFREKTKKENIFTKLLNDSNLQDDLENLLEEE